MVICMAASLSKVRMLGASDHMQDCHVIGVGKYSSTYSGLKRSVTACSEGDEKP
ncbi:hypothetical protein BAUCODRAFT_126544 [Baudoinia panamericana UAMH 10762]|uniref:Uncharacterized protein n=1 Tax=Baudoinia panamericana (strain UAMH 10762) TaxID=717646 RepID=M2M4M0_BAUPA|nr:uncharacterized protein BAUCODRAFT_126544 [Baudoinia panamericana UAMH 10762]EMC91541.1 hypothetical protein BAUCODRAFT_126544 [Baudoinia panamericana UAMH 10762]